MNVDANRPPQKAKEILDAYPKPAKGKTTTTNLEHAFAMSEYKGRLYVWLWLIEAPGSKKWKDVVSFPLTLQGTTAAVHYVEGLVKLYGAKITHESLKGAHDALHQVLGPLLPTHRGELLVLMRWGEASLFAISLSRKGDRAARQATAKPGRPS